MRYLNLITLMLLGALLSCKKHRLKNDKEVFEGKWEWVYSVESTSYNSPGQHYMDTIFPTGSIGYSIVFKKSGKVSFFKNDQFVDKYRIVFSTFQEGSSQVPLFPNNGTLYDFRIKLDNKDENSIWGYISTDSLFYQGSDFPFQNESNALFLRTHQNYFKKVN